MSSIDWGNGKKEYMPEEVSFLYNSKEDALSDLKKVYEKIGFIGKPREFDNYSGDLIHEKTVKVGHFRKRDKLEFSWDPSISIDLYSDGNIKGQLLTIKIITGLSRSIDISNLEIVKALEIIRKENLEKSKSTKS